MPNKIYYEVRNMLLESNVKQVGTYGSAMLFVILTVHGKNYAHKQNSNIETSHST